METDPAGDETDPITATAKPRQASTNPLEIIDRIGIRFFDMAALVALLTGTGLTALAVLTSAISWFQTGIAAAATLQAYFPIGASPDMGPTPSVALNSLVLLVWQAWIVIPLVAVTAFSVILFRKIASEFRR